MFLGWSDPDRARPVRGKVCDALLAWVNHFDQEPTMLICHPRDWARFERERAKGIGGTAPLNLTVRTEAFIPRNTFYVGCDETEGV